MKRFDYDDFGAELAFARDFPGHEQNESLCIAKELSSIKAEIKELREMLIEITNSK